MENKTEIEFLEGPRSRFSEFVFTLSTMMDFIRGFRGLHFVGPCITVFGSARFSQDHPYYELTRKVAASFAKMGFTIMTGGGPGLMEAANRGAREVGGKSVACNIILPKEQLPNPYLDKWVAVKHFFVRKILLVKYSFAFIVMPGGYGTLDECFEALTLIQTKKIKNFPVIVFDRAYHAALIQHIAKMVDAGTIARDDLDLLLVSDDLQAAIELIAEKSIKRYGLRPRAKVRPLSWLFER